MAGSTSSAQQFLSNRVGLFPLFDDGLIDKVTKKIIAALQQPFHPNNEVASISVSIGVTNCPEDSTNISTLLRNADKAMYLAKDAGRNCWRSFTDVGEAGIQKKEEHHVEI